MQTMGTLNFAMCKTPSFFPFGVNVVGMSMNFGFSVNLEVLFVRGHPNNSHWFCVTLRRRSFCSDNAVDAWLTRKIAVFPLPVGAQTLTHPVYDHTKYYLLCAHVRKWIALSDVISLKGNSLVKWTLIALKIEFSELANGARIYFAACNYCG